MAFVSDLWNSLVGNNDKEEKIWRELSTFYFDGTRKYFSVSEIDKEAIPIVFGECHKIAFNKHGFGYNFTPLNFISVYHIDTRRGLYFFVSFFFSNNLYFENRTIYGFIFTYIGSPYKFHVDSISSGYVTAYGPGLLNGVSGEPSEFTISTKGAGSGGLSMAVEGPSKAEAPSGLEEPCFLKRLPSGNIGISFTPREAGQHIVSVKKMGVHIQNSPFNITVLAQEVGDAKKVKVSGNALKEGKTHSENTFSVDTRNAGYGGLSLSIEGPSKAEIQCADSKDGVLAISYKPTEPGYYIVNLKFADHHVEGSPFTVKVSIPCFLAGSYPRTTCITSFDLAATVTSPGGVSEDAEIQEVEDGLYSVHFVPKELGVHTVSVKYREIHIPGSPFQFTVGPLRDSGAHLVKAGGPGLERGEAGRFNEFNVWTREAGAGQLAISLEGPSKAEIDFKDRKDGSCDVSYKVDEPGEYRIGLKFNEQHIPDSPFKVYISPAVGDAHLLEVAQFPDSAQVDKPTQFYIRLNGAKGSLDGRVIAPSGKTDDCFIQNIDGDQYSIRFMPRENGVHNINVKFNGVHIPASPLRIKVGKDDADPAAVHAHGPGLGAVKTGVKTDLIIDTCNAGVGLLAVTMDGPSRVAMDCTDVDEGYKVRYTPLAPGFYYMSIKYNGAHIVGSPFKIEATGANLAEVGAQETSSVTVETVQKVAKSMQKLGPVLPNFKSDASKVTSKGMGNNILYVGIYGPKGPCDEVQLKHKGKNNYECWYVVRDREITSLSSNGEMNTSPDPPTRWKSKGRYDKEKVCASI
ncbi:hypothetical protein HF086_006310 [Spodoptera exigua]|uniref:Filamin-A n=1 Tax=Spodoptera exigua TaxID=7107 RepID=A0A922M2S6_SPOEX|nr:hypothetical protein HF086_006310 [Spodoptera exigua]